MHLVNVVSCLLNRFNSPQVRKLKSSCEYVFSCLDGKLRELVIMPFVFSMDHNSKPQHYFSKLAHMIGLNSNLAVISSLHYKLVI